MTIVHSKVQKCKRCVKVSNGANQVVRCIPSYLFRVERVLQGASIKYVCTDGGVQKLIVLAGYFILGPILRCLYKLSFMQRYRSSRSLDEFKKTSFVQHVKEQPALLCERHFAGLRRNIHTPAPRLARIGVRSHSQMTSAERGRSGGGYPNSDAVREIA